MKFIPHIKSSFVQILTNCNCIL